MQLSFSIDTASPSDLRVLSVIATALSGELRTAEGSGAAAVVNMEKGTGKAPKTPATPAPEKKKDSGKPLSIEQVREKVIAKSTDVSQKAKIKDLLATFGAEKVTALEPGDYAAFVEKLENL